MATYDVTMDVTVTDVNGDTARTSLTAIGVPDAGTLAGNAATASTFAGLVAACTNGKVTQISFSVLVSKAQISAGTAPPPANATYPSVTDGARLSFADTAGFKRTLTVPAPLLTDFKTGSNVVNPVDANIAALITFVEGFGSSPDITNLYEGGAKVGKRLRRRVTHKSL